MRAAYFFAAASCASLASGASTACFQAMQTGVPAQPPPGTKQGSAAFASCENALYAADQAAAQPISIAGCNTRDQINYCLGKTADPPQSFPVSDIPNPGRSTGMPQAVDCLVRTEAWAYAQKLQGATRSADAMKLVFDALGIEEDCGAAPPLPSSPSKAKTAGLATVGIFVDPVAGSDANPGTAAAPLRTIGAAAEAAARAGAGVSVDVLLRPGEHVLGATVQLNASHSNTRFVSAELVQLEGGIGGGAGARVEVTGASEPLSSLSWSFVPGGMRGDRPGDNVWVADVVGAGGKGSFDALRLDGQRVTRARFPNADPELAQTDANYIMATAFPSINWTAAPVPLATTYTTEGDASLPHRAEQMAVFGSYYIGTGGSCAVYDPPESYWCSNHTSGGGAFPFRTPTALQFPDAALPSAKSWKDPVGDGAILNVYRPSRWSNWMFEMASFDAATRTIGFGKGGFQGARGADHGGDFFVENVREELDAPNEFFFDKVASKLYFFHNASAGTPPPASAVFRVPRLQELFHAEASAEAPLANLSFAGIAFTHTAPTYMEPHGVPSGGDWALQRTAALFLEGTTGATVAGCVFERLDGIALMLSGFNRDAAVTGCDFNSIGDSAVAAWGRTKQVPVPGAATPGVTVEGMDGTGGAQPRRTLISGNMIRELGFYSKQASPFFQAKTAQTTITGNIMFNGPRAGINFNDGFGGGNEITENLLFNFCRETSDHGPFNSWDRQPFLTELLDGVTPSLTPLPNEINHNFFIANYESSMCVDNDDGSCFYEIHDNVCAYGGHKSDFAGHSKRTFNSLQIFPKKDSCVKTQPSATGFQDAYFNNTCLQRYGNKTLPAYTFSGCNAQGAPADAADPAATVPHLHGNTFYTPTGDAFVHCTNMAPPYNAPPNAVTLEAWQNKSALDKGSTVHKGQPATTELAAMMRSLLGY
jgi:hypothetical protein